MNNGSARYLIRSALLVVFLSGISGCLYTASTLKNTYYEEDGYRIKHADLIYTYDQSEGKRTLTAGDGYQKRIYVERTGDDRVDVIRYRGEEIQREEGENNSAFERADREWSYYTEQLDTEDVHEKWASMSTEERLQKEGYYHE